MTQQYLDKLLDADFQLILDALNRKNYTIEQLTA
jgi:hypothetical protein